MAKFMATFGVQYSREPHPSGKFVNPDGYVLIFAETYDEAVSLMQAEYGISYAFVTPEEQFAEPNVIGKTGYEYHPYGVLEVLGDKQ